MERVTTRLPAIHRPRQGLARRLIAALLRLDASYREARHLADLPDHMRRDIGLPPVTRARWDAPVIMRK